MSFEFCHLLFVLIVCNAPSPLMIFLYLLEQEFSQGSSDSPRHNLLTLVTFHKSIVDLIIHKVVLEPQQEPLRDQKNNQSTNWLRIWLEEVKVSSDTPCIDWQETVVNRLPNHKVKSVMELPVSVSPCIPEDLRKPDEAKDFQAENRVCQQFWHHQQQDK